MSLSAPKSASRQAPAWKKPGSVAPKLAAVFTPEPEPAADTKGVMDDINAMMNDEPLEDVDADAEQALRDFEADEQKEKEAKADAESKPKNSSGVSVVESKSTARAVGTPKHSGESKSTDEQPAAKKHKTSAPSTKPASGKSASRPGTPYQSEEHKKSVAVVAARQAAAANRYQASLANFMKKPDAPAAAAAPAEPRGADISGKLEQLIAAVNTQSERAEGGFQAALDAMAKQHAAALEAQLTAMRDLTKHMSTISASAKDSKQAVVELVQTLAKTLAEDRSAQAKTFEKSMQLALQAGMSQEVDQARLAISEFLVEKFAEMRDGQAAL